MFDATSRYAAVETVSFKLPDGRTVAYKRRRFLPAGADLAVLAEIAVNQGDRLDLIAARTIGDPLQFWRVCDANDAMDPFELVAQPGALVVIPVPQP
jgi:hypothetical protein